MNVIELSVATRVFRLPADTDLDSLEQRISAAVLSGGALVVIPTIGSSSVSALVTPATPVFVERIDLNDASDDADVSWFEYDYFGEAWAS